MKPLIKKVKGSWRVDNFNRWNSYHILSLKWCHQQNIKEGNYGVKKKAS